jgi:hypothetical protein
VAGRDLYELLGVPRDATPERIRQAYELAMNRAHRDGAHRHAVDLSQAYDTLSNPQRRALYERHGLTAVRERSPGAAPPPTPWREVKRQPPAPAPRQERGGWRMPLLAVFTLGIVAGLLIAAYLVREAQLADDTGSVPSTGGEQRILCETTPGGQGYVYSAPKANRPSCRNGSVPRVLAP